MLALSSTVLAVTVLAGTRQSRPHSGLPSTDLQKINITVPADSLDQQTGLIVAPGLDVVKRTCVSCHSPKLITDKRASRDGWIATIRWMQQNQGLWDLGKDEAVIVDYLAKNYPLQNTGRRPPLQNIKWYKL
ncbi:hypothetical protein GCM10027443_01500 [Pontibacter brevis]